MNVPAGSAATGCGAERVLAIRFGSLGDLLLTFPALTLIKRRFPAARLEILTRPAFAELVATHPSVDHVELLTDRGWRGDLALARRMRRRGYDRVYDLHGTPRSRLVTTWCGAPERYRVSGARLARRWQVAAARWRRWWRRPRPARPRAIEPVALRAARLVEPGFPADALPGLMPRLELTTTTTAAVGVEWVDDPPAPWIALCPGARHVTKCWPDRAYAELAERLLARGLGVLVALGGSDRAPALEALAQRDAEHVRVVRAGLPVLAAALARAAGAVGNDSGLTHLAVAAGVPVVVLFGPTVPELGFAPSGSHAIVEQRELGCRPCAVHGGDRCPRGDHACLSPLGAAEVLAALDSLVPDLRAVETPGARTNALNPES